MIAVTNACLDALAHMQTRVHMLVAGTHTQTLIRFKGVPASNIKASSS